VFFFFFFCKKNLLKKKNKKKTKQIKKKKLKIIITPVDPCECIRALLVLTVLISFEIFGGGRLCFLWVGFLSFLSRPLVWEEELLGLSEFTGRFFSLEGEILIGGW